MMNRKNRFLGFDFDNNFVLNQEINSVPYIQPNLIIVKWQWHLAFDL